jgi:hypothetical protein
LKIGATGRAVLKIGATGDTVPYPLIEIIFEATVNRSFPMSRQNQINLLKRLLHYVDTRTTSMADAPWRNDVSVYTDPRRLAE